MEGPMNNLPIDLMLELARDHERRAKVLWKRAERAIIPDTKAKLMLQANAEQQTANAYSMRVRNLTPRPMKITA
jgi:hypothetical protein